MLVWPLEMAHVGRLLVVSVGGLFLRDMWVFVVRVIRRACSIVGNVSGVRQAQAVMQLMRPLLLRADVGRFVSVSVGGLFLNAESEGVSVGV